LCSLMRINRVNSDEFALIDVGFNHVVFFRAVAMFKEELGELE